jgi:preprotein translocase subunit SecD
MFKEFVSNPRYVLLVVLSIAIFAVMVDIPRANINIDYNLETSPISKVLPGSLTQGKSIKINREFGGYSLNLFGGRYRRDLEVKQGLDIAGGVSVLLNADMSGIPEADRKSALNSLKDVIERRVNLLGISEASVQTSQTGNNFRVIVELAGTFDTEQALKTIGQVAQLEFRTQGESQEIEIPNQDDPEGEPQKVTVPQYDKTDLTGADLRKAEVVFGQASTGGTTNMPQIQLQFNTDGTRKFRELTQSNIGKQLAIYLDEEILIAPTVESAITDGTAVITGQFTVDEAKAISAQLNAGALPIPVAVLEQRTIGPTLGQESVDRSIFAGAIGLLLVIIFMILYYGRLGFLASIALVIYGLLTLALYKLIPVVLTLPGLAGFILSIGMAVDANILIFERIKEELRMDKPFGLALENGFGRSWDSIRDANFATLMTAFILFNPFEWGFLPTSGPVRGFALTLALGIFISLFTGVFITRNLVRVFYTKRRSSI